MAHPRWKCENCGKDFTVGEWQCVDGTSHVVPKKEYRTLDAPLDPGRAAEGSMNSMIRGRTVVCNIPPATKVMENGEVKWVGEGSVEFINGYFATTNPEHQYWLDKKPAYNATLAQWKERWLTSNERLADKELELTAMATRLENERNDLLSQTRQKVKASA